MSDTLDKVYESLASRTDLTSFDRRIYELLLAFHRLPLPNYNMPPLSMLASRSNQTEKAVMQCLFRLRDAGLVRVLTDRSGIFPTYYRVIENPVLPAPAEPVLQAEPEPQPVPSQIYWVVPYAVCTITFISIETPEADDTPPELVQADTDTSEPGIKPQTDTQAKQRARVICCQPLILPACRDVTANKLKTYPEVIGGELCFIGVKLCRAASTGLQRIPSNLWLGLFAPR